MKESNDSLCFSRLLCLYIIEPDLLESNCIIYDNSNRNIFSWLNEIVPALETLKEAKDRRNQRNHTYSSTFILFSF